jgi:hypothetical protein
MRGLLALLRMRRSTGYRRKKINADSFIAGQCMKNTARVINQFSPETCRCELDSLMTNFLDYFPYQIYNGSAPIQMEISLFKYFFCKFWNSLQHIKFFRASRSNKLRIIVQKGQKKQNL